jgi:thermitase
LSITQGFPVVASRTAWVRSLELMFKRGLAWLPLGLLFVALALGPVSGDAATPTPNGADRVRAGEVLVELRAGASPDAVARRAGASRRELVRRTVHRLKVPPGQERARAEALKRDPDVVAAAPNYIRSASDLTPNDPLYGQQWWLPKIAAPAAWSTATGSPSIIVAVLDSGADLTHPDLQANLVPGINTLCSDPDWVPPSATYCATATEQDDYGHGTHVAGIVAAVGNNGVGVASVAWSAKVQPVKVLDGSGNGSDAQIIAGIDWAREHGAKVLNMSLGGPGQSDVLDAAVNRAWQSGMVVTASAGNQNSGVAFYPAASPNALGVAATNASDERWFLSNFGSFVDIAAPGDGILSIVRGGGYDYKTGTSMASPVVAGAAALVWTTHPGYQNAQVVSQLIGTADKVGSTPYDTAGRNDQMGYGRLDLAQAVQTTTTTTRLAWVLRAGTPP